METTVVDWGYIGNTGKMETTCILDLLARHMGCSPSYEGMTLNPEN